VAVCAAVGAGDWMKRRWPDLNDVAIVAFAIAIIRWVIKKDKREGGWDPPKQQKPNKNVGAHPHD
jgi:hypothetical protein